MNDALSDDDLSAITGVDKNARLRDAKRSEILTKAGITHWFKHSEGIATTWHHVHHAAKPTEAPAETSQPRLSKVK